MNRLTKTSLLATFALSAMLLGTACGDDDDDAPAADAALSDASTTDADTTDAGGTIDADDTDAFMPVGSPSCAELTTPTSTLSTFPGTYVGDLADAENNLNITNDIVCTTANAPDGQAGNGPDEVVKLTGLTPGQKYFAKLFADEDLGMYVITACDETAPGPTADSCLAFVDTFPVATEVTSFTAPKDGTAFVVVDYYSGSMPIGASAYSLTIDTEGCASDTECTDPATPICQLDTATCGSNEYCVGDDTVAEAQSDDTPAGATVVTLGAAPVVINAHICSAGADSDEFDFYAVTVPAAGGFSVAVSFPATAGDVANDLDIYVNNADGNGMGFSWWGNPEGVTLTHLPAGTYYVQVDRFSPDDTTDVTPYTITFTQGAVSLCTTTADCASTFLHQSFRGSCDLPTGACVNIEGEGAVALGGVCDSNDDCGAAAELCAGFVFTANADTHSVCSVTCTTDADCTAVGAGFKCTSGGDDNFCLAPCTADNQCPTNTGAQPDPGADWVYSTCNVAEGRCQL